MYRSAGVWLSTQQVQFIFMLLECYAALSVPVHSFFYRYLLRKYQRTVYVAHWDHYSSYHAILAYWLHLYVAIIWTIPFNRSFLHRYRYSSSWHFHFSLSHHNIWWKSERKRYKTEWAVPFKTEFCFNLISFRIQEAEQSLRFYRNARPSTSDETEPFKSELEKLRASHQISMKSYENSAVTLSDLSKETDSLSGKLMTERFTKIFITQLQCQRGRPLRSEWF